ncbi:hypothetical protein ACB094_09G124600 [Castanea mollissima]
MAQQIRKLLPFFVFMLSFISCYSTLQKDPLRHFGEESGFKNVIKQSTHVLRLKRFDRILGTISTSGKTINVNDYGAKGDGTDDTEISGTLEASNVRSDYSQDGRHWLLFDSVQNLIVEGGGTINGNGKIWWQNSCKVNKALALTFFECKYLTVNNLKIRDAQQIHTSFEKCMNIQVSLLTITAPEDSPNTDGIHVADTQDIQISSCDIGTGDDCISIASGSQNVQARDITCGPGHGISIGSLGSGNSESYVSGVTINGAKLYGTTNGVRIKTWKGGSGSASNIKFQNVEMHNVANPIIIDQNYCDQDKPCSDQKSAVQVKNVLYQNIYGTSASDVAIEFNCSNSFPCQKILLQSINLEAEKGKKTEALCNNVKSTDTGIVSPHCP